MKLTISKRHLKVKTSKRALKMLADQAIGNDLMKGFLELITNSDESYARLENKGIQTNGRIEIEVDRRTRTKQTIVRVIDWAEGMDEPQLERCVGSYGEDTSGQIGRGVFGMGLKDTINAFGEGTIVSFKDGQKCRCKLHDVDDLEIDTPRPVSGADKSNYHNTSGGTIVEIVVQNPKVRIPIINSLRQQVQKHVCLRGIMMDSARSVVLRDLRSGSADPLRYQQPEATILVDNVVLDLPGFPDLKPTLTVRQAVGTDALSQAGSDRTGGILITSKRTVHEATLFGFDDDPHAARLFGELRCDDIYDLQAKGDPIVDKNRNGLQKNHPLTAELFRAARKVIEDLVTAAKQREKHERQTLEREETLKRFKEAVKNLNDIARRELQIGGFGSGQGKGLPTEARAPQDGFEFIPDTYRVVLAERESLKLRVQVDGSTGFAVGDKVEIMCDNPNIRILDDRPVIGKLFQEDPPLAIVPVFVEGLQANAIGFVSAKCNGKSAIAAVEVVSEKKQTHHHATGGLFKEIKYEERPEPTRAHFDRKEAVIYINTLGPSVDLYFGPGGAGQELPPNQVMVAELVTELACQEIARVKRETKILDVPPGIDELDAYISEFSKLKGGYGPQIHTSLVSPDCRRK